MKKLLPILVIFVLIAVCLTACEEEGTKQSEQPKQQKEETYTIIKFSDMYEIKGTTKEVSTAFKNLNGKKVELKGYPAVQSPLDESFVYLNNQPYVTCPFCTIGDITKLEVIPIYMADNSKISYTENQLTVYGRLEVAEKVDSENYTTQFRIYADKVIENTDNTGNKEVEDYYALLSKQGMIYDIQTLQMNIEYATNPDYMKYYDENYQTGKSNELDKIAIVKAIKDEYLDYDNEFASGSKTYLDYIKECPIIVKNCEPKNNENLKALNDELIKLYEDEIVLLEKYQNICYKIAETKDIDLATAEGFLKELHDLNPENLNQYNTFTAWNNKLREQ